MQARQIKKEDPRKPKEGEFRRLWKRVTGLYTGEKRIALEDCYVVNDWKKVRNEKRAYSFHYKKGFYKINLGGRKLSKFEQNEWIKHQNVSVLSDKRYQIMIGDVQGNISNSWFFIVDPSKRDPKPTDFGLLTFRPIELMRNRRKVK